jgi:predicted nucleic acid-binding protein
VTSLVVDASATIAWFMPDERTLESEAVRDRVTDDGALVPALWPIEVGNTFLLAVRHGRISMAQRGRVAERFRLTLYDACYLELAQRHDLPLASLDRELRSAATKLGLTLLGK